MKIFIWITVHSTPTPPHKIIVLSEEGTVCVLAPMSDSGLHTIGRFNRNGTTQINHVSPRLAVTVTFHFARKRPCAFAHKSILKVGCGSQLIASLSASFCWNS